MAYEPGAIDPSLAAALGHDLSLIAELRLAFVESAQRTHAVLAEAKDAFAWTDAAHRLKGLAASFGDLTLMTACEEAAATPLDPSASERLARLIAQI